MPTEAEAKVLARQARKRERRPPVPTITVVSETNESGERVAVLKVKHADKDILNNNRYDHDGWRGVME